MAGSNNEYLLRTIKKDDFNFNSNNPNSSFIRLKSASRLIHSNADNYNNKFPSANNGNLLTSFSQKKQKNINNNSNLYQNYISSLTIKKNEEKKKKNYAIPSFDENDKTNNKYKEDFYIRNKLNKKNKPNIANDHTFNKTFRLNSETNKSPNNIFVKNRVKNNKLFPNINTFTYNSKMFEKEDTKSFFNVRGPFPLKFKRLKLNSTNNESLKDNKIKNFLDKNDFEYFK
jgi:hypothetical protein